MSEEYKCCWCGLTSDHCQCIKVLEESHRLISSGEVKANVWHEFDVFSGRMIEQQESSQRVLKRALRQAQETLGPTVPREDGRKG